MSWLGRLLLLVLVLHLDIILAVTLTAASNSIVGLYL